MDLIIDVIGISFEVWKGNFYIEKMLEEFFVEDKVDFCISKIIVELVIFCYVFGIIFYVLVI